MAKIYKLTCEDPELIYYGSTTKELNDRLCGHRCDNKRSKNYSPKPLFEKGNVKINLIEECSIEDRFKREAYYITTFPCVNKEIPYYQGNSREERRKIINKITVEKRKKTIECECGATFSKSHKLDHLKTKKHLNFVNHGIKHKPSEEPKQTCECGSITGKYDLSKHKKTKKHQDYINKL